VARASESGERAIVTLARGATLGLIAFVTAALGALAWCLAGPLDAVRRRLSDRFVDWLLPDRQASTMRLALTLAALASRLSPKHHLIYTKRSLASLVMPTWRSVSDRQYGLVREPNDWRDPEAARQELLSDLEHDSYVVRPVRFVLPLLRIAVGLRVRNTVVLLRALSGVALRGVEWAALASGGVAAVFFGAWQISALFLTAFIGATALCEVRYRRHDSPNADYLSITWRARAHVVGPIIIVLVVIGMWLTTDLLTPPHLVRDIGFALPLLIWCYTFSIALLVDCYFTLPRLTAGVSGVHFRASSHSAAVRFTQVQVIKAVVVYPIVTVAALWIQIDVLLRTSVTPHDFAALTFQAWFLIIVLALSVFLALALIPTLLAARSGFAYAASMPFVLGARVDARDLGVSSASGERLVVEAIDVGRRGVLWAPVVSGDEAFIGGRGPIVIGFADLLCDKNDHGRPSPSPLLHPARSSGEPGSPEGIQPTRFARVDASELANAGDLSQQQQLDGGDRLPVDERVLFAEVSVVGTSISLDYWVDPPASMQAGLRKRLEARFSKLRLRESYIAEGIGEFSDKRSQLEWLLTTGSTSEDVRAYLNQEAAAVAASRGVNHWRTVALSAFAANNEVCSGAFRTA
jgi:hypothetical protein